MSELQFMEYGMLNRNGDGVARHRCKRSVQSVTLAFLAFAFAICSPALGKGARPAGEGRKPGKGDQSQQLSDLGYIVGKEVNGGILGARTEQRSYYIGEPIWLNVKVKNRRTNGTIDYYYSIRKGKMVVESDAPDSAYYKKLKRQPFPEDNLLQVGSLAPGEVRTFKVLLNKYFDLSVTRDYGFWAKLSAQVRIPSGEKTVDYKGKKVKVTASEKTKRMQLRSGHVKIKIRSRPAGWSAKKEADKMGPIQDLYLVGRTLPKALSELQKPKSERKQKHIKYARIVLRDVLPVEKRDWSERLGVAKTWATARTVQLLHRERNSSSARSIVISRLRVTLGQLTGKMPKDGLPVWRRIAMKWVLELLEQEESRAEDIRDDELRNWCIRTLGRLLAEECSFDAEKWRAAINGAIY
jgi:hypothetical protein